MARYGDLELIVAVDGDGSHGVLVPFYSDADLFASGVVDIAVSVNGEPCGELAVTVSGLPSSDKNPTVKGGFERIVSESVSNLDFVLSDTGLTREDLATPDESGELQYGLLFMLDYIVRGEDNPNSLERMLTTSTVRIDGESVSLDMDVLDGLVAWQKATLAEHGARVTGASFPPPRNRVKARTPAGLFELMSRQHFAEQTLLPGIEIALAGVGAIGAVAAALPPPANAIALATVVADIAGTIAQWGFIARDVQLLPNSVTLSFGVSEPVLDEDGTGKWSNLVLEPSNQGAYDTTESLIALTLSTVGVGSQAKGARALVTSLVTTVLGKANQKAKWDSSERFPYEWDPVAIETAEAAKWVVPYGDSGVVQRNDNQGTYEAMTVGVGAVGLAVRPELVQHRLFSGLVAVEVLPIEVRIEPSDPPDLDPGETACFVAIVENAIDMAVEWSLDGAPWSGDPGCWTAPDSSELTDACADGAHSVIIGATSTSKDGARQEKYDPPERSDEVVLNVVCDQAIHFQGSFNIVGYVYETDPDKCQQPIELRVWGQMDLEARPNGDSELTVLREGTSFGPTCFSYHHPSGNWSPQQLDVSITADGISLSATYADDAGQWTYSATGPLDGPLTGVMQHDYWYGQEGTISGTVVLEKQP